MFITVIQTAAFSVLTDHDSQNGTGSNISELDFKNADVFRQLLNQETIIRITLVKNVHVLMKDMLTMQEKLSEAENKISEIKTSHDHEIKELKKEVNLLKTENGLLKNKSASFQKDLEDFYKNLDNASNTLTDVKIEVRYLSITLFDINARSHQMAEVLQQVNASTEDTKLGMVDSERNLSAALSELETQHNRALDDIHNTTRTLKADFDRYKADHWRLSASVSSLELFRNNQTNTKCDLNRDVAFTAAVTSSSLTWNSGTLIFNVVITNAGNGYNPSTGVFTSPLSGTYVFFVTALEYSSQYLATDIVLNGVSKVRLSCQPSASYQTGTNMVVLNLQEGDTVWAKHAGGKGYYTESVPITTFSGFLI